MKDILNELLEEFPELKGDEEKIKKVVYYLNQSKPDIKASKEFKIDLKNRLDSLIVLKNWQKTSFLKFAIPVFAFCFIVFWVFYFYKDFEEFKNNQFQDENVIQTSKMLESVDYDTWWITEIENDYIEEWMYDETQDFNDNNAEKELKEDTIDISEDNIGVMDTVTLFWIENIFDENWWDASTWLWDTYSSVSVNQSSQVVDDEMINNEIDEMVTLIDALFKDIEDDVRLEKEFISFDDYCAKNDWKIIIYSAWKVCEKDWLECKEENYIDWKCEFVPVN